MLYHLFVCLNESSQTSSSGFKPTQAALDNLKQRKIGQQSQEAIVKQRFSKEQREAKDTEEVETGTGTRPNIASYLLREDSLELQFLYVSQILNNPQFQTDNKTNIAKGTTDPRVEFISQVLTQILKNEASSLYQL